ncbi:MAG TPA: VanZ family protein [Syntrophales bacterium]|nr:VanZ family protein [Syntrophales bacterium]
MFIKFSRQWFQERGVKFYGVVFLAICMGMLIIGLWPFNFRPANKVAWLGDRNGVKFYGYATITGSNAWNKEPASLFPDKAISLELWLHPLMETSGLPRILTLYDGKTPDIVLVGQWMSHLAVRSRKDDTYTHKLGKSYKEIGITKALQKDRDVFITITSGKEGSTIYINGKLAGYYPRHQLLSGYNGEPVRLVLGNLTTGESCWTGYLTGLAIYNRALTAKQVLNSYQKWIQKGAPSAEGDDCVALYLFNERKGQVIRNHLNPDNQLAMPEIFKPVKFTVLDIPWSHDDFKWNRSFFQDVTINIVGFIPFGFFCAALLIKTHRFKTFALYIITVLLGFGLSLAIEMLQVYLPTRDSSLIDVICNVLGTIMGLLLYQITVFPSSETAHE